MQLLESAGFSSSNPYYIVPQGRITALCNAKDHERLTLLKEVAGTSVYETRRRESQQLLEDTNITKRAKIEESLQFFEEKLAELEEEKEELKAYSELDKERRCLEYTIYERELNEVSGELENLEEQRRAELGESNKKRSDYGDLEKLIADQERQLNELRQSLEELRLEKEQLSDEKTEQNKAIIQAEILLKEKQDTSNDTSERKKTLEVEMKALSKEIRAKEDELAQVIPEFEKHSATEKKLKGRFDEAERLRSSLYSKQGRAAQFKNRQARDKWLKTEIEKIKDTKKTQGEQAKALKLSIESTSTQLTTVTEEISSIRNQMDSRKDDTETIATDFRDVKQKRNEAMDKRKQLWKEQDKLSSSIGILKDEIKKNEDGLVGSMDKATAQGLRAVKNIAERLNLQGYFGPLYELFEVEDKYRTAVDEIVGSSLFHIVVDNDATATTLLTHLNRERSGRVTFMPLNRLRPKPMQYPNANDAIPLVKKIKGDDKFRLAFEQVWGKAVVCPNLEVAAGYSRGGELTAVTLDGDRVDRKGAISGGYRDHRKSRLEILKSIKTWKSKLQTEEKRLAEVKEQVVAIEQLVTKYMGDLQRLEMKKTSLVDSREPLIAELNSKLREEVQLKDALRHKESSLESLLAAIKTFESQQKEYEAEMKTEMTSGLTADETNQLESLTTEIEQIKEQLVETAGVRAKLQSTKAILESTLNNNLLRRRIELESELDNLSITAASANVTEVSEEDLPKLYKTVERLEERLKKIENDMEELKAQETESLAVLERQKVNRTSPTFQIP
ncbi:hypothetical protein BKA69DRAFT_365194 [Paraphysoderma sedebokerense]|nr:hypothetical protein BKA69DRAFT_365194 [Paraphysoderma sedebokerense]